MAAPNPAPAPDKGIDWRTVRYLAALAVGLVAAVVPLWLSHDDGSACRVEATREHGMTVGKTATATSSTATNKVTTKDHCRDFAAAQLLPFALLIGILLLPDLSELGITGLITLKRKVEQQAARQEELERQLIDVRLSAQQNVSVVVNHVDEKVERKVPLFRNLQVAPDPAAAEAMAAVPAVDADAAPLIVELLRLSEALWRYERPGPAWDLLSAAQVEAVRRWRNVFQSELRMVRGFRNVVAHGETDPDLAQLDDVVRAARRLNELLQEALAT